MLWHIVAVVTATRQQCQASYAVRVPAPNGFLASVVTEQTGCGNTYRPWLIEVGLTQRINFTLYDFHTVTLSRSSLSTCKEYLTIREGSDSSQAVSVCGGHQRIRHVYTSKTNKVEVLFTTLRNPASMTFMLHYEGMSITVSLVYQFIFASSTHQTDISILYILLDNMDNILCVQSM